MDFKNRIREAIQTIPQWKDITADTVEWGEHSTRRNDQRCHEINSEIAYTLNRQEGMEALLVATHYPPGTSSPANFFVLARSKDSGEVMLVDGVINSNIEGMREPFIGSFAEAQRFMKQHTSVKWDENWDLNKRNNNIVVHQAEEVPLEKRNAIRNRFKEFGELLRFDLPKSRAIPGERSVLDQNMPSSGYTLTLADMNRFAAMRGLPNNFLIRRPEAPEEKPAAAAEREEALPLAKMSFEMQQKALIEAVQENREEKRAAVIGRIGELLSPDNPFQKQLANTRDVDIVGGPTILHLTALHGDADAAWLIIEAGADIYAKDMPMGQTAMHYAARNTKKFAGREAEKEVEGKVRIVGMLAAKDAELNGRKAHLVNTTDEDGNAPAHVAVDTGSYKAGLALVEAGADVKDIRRDKDNKSPIELAQIMRRRSPDHERLAVMMDFAADKLYGRDRISMEEFRHELPEVLGEGQSVSIGRY